MKKLFGTLLCSVMTLSSFSTANAIFQDYNYNQEVKVFIDYKNYNIPRKNNENMKLIEQTLDDGDKEYRFAIGEPFNVGIRIPQNSNISVDGYQDNNFLYNIYEINDNKNHILFCTIKYNYNINSIDQLFKELEINHHYKSGDREFFELTGIKDFSKIKWTSKYLKNAAKVYKIDSKYVDFAAIQDLNNNFYIIASISSGEPVDHNIMNRFLSGMEFYSADQPIKYINRNDSATYRNYIKKTGKLNGKANVSNSNSYEQSSSYSDYETYSEPKDNYIDTLKNQYDYVGEFSEGLALAKKKGEKYCVYIDMNGIPVITIPKMYYGSKFKNGIAEICIDGITEKYIDNIYDPTFFINRKGEFLENPTTELNPIL